MNARNRPLTVVIDTREQRELVFSSTVEVIRAALPEGDYTSSKLRGLAVFERKSLADVVASLTKHRARFFRELVRLRGYQFAAIIIEGSMSDVMNGSYRSAANPNSILGSLVAIWVDFGIPFIFADNARTAAVVVEKTLRRLETQTQQEVA